MYLKRLELNGFKSFANKTILEFPRSQKNRFDIAAIIGPNGSGKSNLAESIRWALGEQSIKSLRAKKSKDIIFSGSKEKARLNLAEVVLVFNNEDGAAPIDYKEFIITRRIYRNGEGEYRLNKSRVRLQDILLLLARANFGQKSYSIIGQGMVDQILITSPQERKKFFDEATGIKQYIYKKDIAMRKIEKSRNNLQQAEITLNEISPRLKSLTRQINKLSQRQAIEGKLIDLQKKYYGPLLKGLNQETSTLKNKLKAEFKKQKEIEEKLKNWQKESETIVYEKIDQQQQKIQYEYQKILKIKNDCLSQQSVLRGQLIFEQEKQKPDQQKINISVDQEKIFISLNKVQNQQ
ncbi:AAA family ATPase [Patescibacteria group bacterium]|nr:AAA family ATPase [Patescibacteria group bacterium]